MEERFNIFAGRVAGDPGAGAIIPWSVRTECGNRTVSRDTRRGVNVPRGHSPAPFAVRLREAGEVDRRVEPWNALVAAVGEASPSRDLRWLPALSGGLRQEAYVVEAASAQGTVGLLPLLYVKSRLFGRFLVSLPYLNTGGVLADDDGVAAALIENAVVLADRLDVRYLELRHERRREHAALSAELTSKVHMRLPLPPSSEALWKGFSSKVRNQVRKGEKRGLSVHWGREDLLGQFYAVFARNMRDLGTPVYGRRFFARILEHLGNDAELCVVRLGEKPVAAALLTHGRGMTEVPSASSLREYNGTNANMLMYWHLLCRAVERGRQVFDFGRSTADSTTYRFKRQWGAQPAPAVWQYYVREGTAGDMRRESPHYQRLIALWQRLPVPLTRWLGPWIVRGIP